MLKAVNQPFDKLLLLREQVDYHNICYTGYNGNHWADDDTGILDS